MDEINKIINQLSGVECRQLLTIMAAFGGGVDDLQSLGGLINVGNGAILFELSRREIGVVAAAAIVGFTFTGIIADVDDYSGGATRFRSSYGGQTAIAATGATNEMHRRLFHGRERERLGRLCLS